MDDEIVAIKLKDNCRADGEHKNAGLYNVGNGDGEISPAAAKTLVEIGRADQLDTDKKLTKKQLEDSRPPPPEPAAEKDEGLL